MAKAGARKIAQFTLRMTNIDWSERLSWKEVVAYLIILVLYVVVSILLGRYVYPSLGVSFPFLMWPDGRGSIAPFLFAWAGVLFILTSIPFFRKRVVLSVLLSVGGGTVLAVICLLWLASR